MSTSATTGFSYDYVFDLALRLSPEEQGRLLRELPNGTMSRDTMSKDIVSKDIVLGSSAAEADEKRECFLSETDAVPYSHEEFYDFLLSGPVIDEEHIQLMLEAKGEVNRCHPISW